MDDPDGARTRLLYDEHAAALWRYARRQTGDRARAEDVVQETLLRAWQHPEITDGERLARAWPFTVARNMIIDERRSTVPQRGELAGRSGFHRACWSRRGQCRAGPVLIREALARVSAAHRGVVRRSYYLGWTTAQIAEDLQIAERTVKSRLHSAVRALQLSLQEMGVTRVPRLSSGNVSL
jgi:RNA polymerase sigma-70 factor, ECF subfamily